jgi:hypothetical protein
MKTVVAFVFALATASATGSRGVPVPTDPQETQNAAVKYLRADAALRQSYPLTPDAATSLETALASPLDAQDEQLVAAAEEALVEFEHGASLKHCDWAMSVEDGPLTNTAHRGAVAELVLVAGLRARLRFRSGDTTGAMKDALAAMAGARHLSVDGSLASVLISFKQEKELIEVFAQNLDRFSQEELNELASGLDALPRGSDIRSAFEAEKLSRNDLLPVAEAVKSREDLIDDLVKRIPALRSDRARATEIVDGCGGSIRGFLHCVSEQASFYSSWAARFTLPPEQFESVYKTQMGIVSKANPVIRVFTPNLPRLRWAQAYSETRQALLEAAIRVRLNGRNALRQVPDPYDGSPFSYVQLERGFELKSRLSEDGTLVSLAVALP